MENLEFFKSYIEHIGENHKYAFGVVDEGGSKFIRLFDGTVSDKTEYKNKNIVDGQLYRISPATCGHDVKSGGDGSCEVGARKLSCTAYSENKCAVYYLSKITLEEFEYTLSYEDIKNLKLSNYVASINKPD